MSVLSIYQHGSSLTATDPHDIDVLVVTEDEELLQATENDPTRAAARRLVNPFVLDMPASLFLDVHVCHPNRLTLMEVGLIQTGRLLHGDDLAGRTTPIRPGEWARLMAALAHTDAPTLPAKAALSAIRTIMASDEGIVVVGKNHVVAEASPRWVPLATAAWPARHDATFTHPDLALALRLAEAIYDELTWHRLHGLRADLRAGWALTEDQASPALVAFRDAAFGDHDADVVWRAYAGQPAAPWYPEVVDWTEDHLPMLALPGPSAIWTEYHPDGDPLAFTPEDCDRALTDVEWDRTELKGNPHWDGVAPQWLVDKLAGVATAANGAWWRFDVTWWTAHIKRLGPGDYHHPHVDRVPAGQERKLFAVVLLSDPNTHDGHLEFTHGSTTTIKLQRGSVVVCPAWVAHQVTTVTEGERVTAVLQMMGPAFR